jgi:hypothetical protein
MSGPSAVVIPRAFPPFLLKCEIMSSVIGWNTSAGRRFSTVLMGLISSWKIFTMSFRIVGLFLTVSVQYV